MFGDTRTRASNGTMAHRYALQADKSRLERTSEQSAGLIAPGASSGLYGHSVGDKDTPTGSAPSRQDTSLDQTGSIRKTGAVSFARLFSTQRQISTRRSLRACGCAPIGGGCPSVVRYADDTVCFEGVVKCKSYFCLSCSSRKSQKDADKTKDIIVNAQKRGYSVYFITNTLSSRDNASKFGEFIKTIYKVYNSALSRHFRSKSGIIGYIRASDFTVNVFKKTLHQHYHSLIIVDSSKIDCEDRFKDEIKRRWCKYAQKNDAFAAYSNQDVQKISSSEQIAKYCAKSFNTAELTSTRKSFASGLTLRGLVEAISSGASHLIPLYRDVERALYGHQRIVWSKGCAEFDFQPAGLEPTEVEIKEKQKIPLEVWYSFEDIRDLIKVSFVYGSISKIYFQYLCDSILIDGEYPTPDEMNIHKLAFKRALQKEGFL